MSELSKKIAMFNQRSLNNNNNTNNINNNINKKGENKVNEDMKSKIKTEREENKNLINNQSNNKFQNKLALFQKNEKNNQPKNFNNESKKFETNKKENEKVKSTESKKLPIINKNENGPKSIPCEKINIFSNNNKKEKEHVVIEKETEQKNGISQNINILSNHKEENETKVINKENEHKINFSDKINIFNKNKKENETKINSKINNETKIINKESDKKQKFLEKINQFNKNNKENEEKIINKDIKENVKTAEFSEKINIFQNFKKQNEQKQIFSGKNNSNNNRNEYLSKSIPEEKINIFNNNNKKENEETISQNQIINNNSNQKENEPSIISERLNIFSNKENSQILSSEKEIIINQKIKDSQPQSYSSETMNINNNINEKNENSDDQKEEDINNENENSSNENTEFNPKFQNINIQINNDITDYEIPSFKKSQDIINKNPIKNIKLDNNNNEFDDFVIISDDEINLNVNKNSKEKGINKKDNLNQKTNKTPTISKKISNNTPNNNNFQNEKDEIEEIFLKTDLIPENVINETFCMGFFITSFNIQNPQIIENSKELYSDCGHIYCTTSSQAIKPEIIFRYPQNDTKDFEISDLGASICFPNGIKICFEKNETRIKNTKNYSSILTNQNGKRYFMMTYHYFYKSLSKDFNINSNLENQFIEAINSSEYIYIPCCLSLLSKYPYFNQMDKCLESMRFTLENFDSNPSEIYNLITYLVKSIPIPPLGTKLFFPIPYFDELISINQPLYKDSVIFGDNPVILLEYLSVEEIILIFRLLLFEQKILIIGYNYHDIAQFTYNFILLLYPLQWVHTQISIMTEKMMKYLQSFLPFFNGMHISLYELTSNILGSITENIFIVDINKRTFELNTNPNLNSKNVIKKINEIVPQLPKSAYNNMSIRLKILKSYFDNKKKEDRNYNINNAEEMESINMKIKYVFIQTFLEILYDYKNYLSVIGNKPIFNTNGLLEKRPKSESNFYKEFTTTQLFQMFIQNNSDSGNQKNETFFEEQLNIYLQLKEKNDFREQFINNYIENTGIYEYNIIKYEKLNSFDLNNTKNATLINEDDLTLNGYKRYISQKYDAYKLYFKPNCVNLKSNKRVIKNKILLEHNKIPCKYKFYIIPNQQFNLEIIKRQKTFKNKNLNENKTKIKNGELSQEQKDDITENIIDVLTKLFKNEEIEDFSETKKLILNSLSTDYGRELYTDILIENNNISNESTFQILTELIFDSIQQIEIKSKEKRLIYCVKLIKCCQNFRKEENKKYIYLSDVLYPKFQKLQILSEPDFWKEWALLDLKLYKEGSDDEKWIIVLKNIEKIMPNLGYNKTSIYSTIADLGQSNIKDEPTFLRFMREVVQNLEIFKN